MAADAGATSRRQASEPRQASPKAVRAAGADVGEPIDLDVDARTEPIAPVITLTAGEPAEPAAGLSPARTQTPFDPALGSDERRAATVYREAVPSVVYLEHLSEGASSPDGSASGWIWDGNGHLVTNHHVIDGRVGDIFKVVLHDGAELEAEAIGGYPRGDIAVLRIKRGFEGLAPAKRGDSDALVVGQDAFAIGSPLSLRHSFTRGIISGLDREMMAGGGPMRGLIQTDAVFSNGSSGGALLDCVARVVGMTTLKLSTGCGSGTGLGLAVPMRLIERIVPRLIRGEKVTHPSLGLGFVEARALRQLSLDVEPEGVVVASVPRGSAAALAGMRALRVIGGGMMIFGGGGGPREFNHAQLGDVIVAIGGKPVRTVKDLYAIVDGYRVGDEV